MGSSKGSSCRGTLPQHASGSRVAAQGVLGQRRSDTSSYMAAARPGRAALARCGEAVRDREVVCRPTRIACMAC